MITILNLPRHLVRWSLLLVAATITVSCLALFGMAYVVTWSLVTLSDALKDEDKTPKGNS